MSLPYFVFTVAFELTSAPVIVLPGCMSPTVSSLVSEDRCLKSANADQNDFWVVGFRVSFLEMCSFLHCFIVFIIITYPLE